MRRLRWLPVVGLLLGLLACAPGEPAAPKAGRAGTQAPGGAAAVASPAEGELTAARISSGPPLEVVYPGASLYQAGAVLPSAAGLAHLDDLAGWLQRRPSVRWRVVVAAPQSGLGDGPALAAKRAELLRRFFRRKGLEPDSWDWQTATGDAGLRLTAVTNAP